VLHREETRLQWTRAAWRAEAERWIRERLAGLDRSVDMIEQPHVRPWGTVFRVAVGGDTVWFKASIPPLAYEVPLLEELGSRRPDRVPRLLVGDEARGWMVIEDAGTRLTELHATGVPIELWEEFLPAYAQLQVDVAADAEEMIAAGIPDRRLAHLIDGFLRVLTTSRLVTGLADDELRRLRALVPRIAEAIDAVAALDLPDSIQHDDLHAWNVCAADGGYRFIDWGDACISQPLLSLYVPLAHVPAGGAARARDAYLEPWTALRPRGELLAACDAAILLAQITGVLKWELINSGLSDDERAGYEDVIPKRLRHLLELVCA
jgi:hypothetical protein